MTDQELSSSILEVETPQQTVSTADPVTSPIVTHNRPHSDTCRFPSQSDEDMERITNKSTSDGTKKQTKYRVANLKIMHSNKFSFFSNQIDQNTPLHRVSILATFVVLSLACIHHTCTPIPLFIKYTLYKVVHKRSPVAPPTEHM